MKALTVFLLICSLFASCSKKDYSNERNQADENQETLTQEAGILEAEVSNTSYVFDIDSFRYLEEFPKTIEDIKGMYPEELFEESIFENTGKGPMGDYAYTLRSPNIWFSFWGNTVEEANLLVVEIFSKEYQCKSIQVIGMSVEELERISGKKLTPEKNVRIYTELYILVIETGDGIVQSYKILASL